MTLLLSGPGRRASSAGSGPARSPGRKRLITFDMGGTSADIGIVTEDGISRGLGARHRGSAAIRCSCRCSTSTRSAPAAARSRTSTRAAPSASARAAPAPTPGPACYGQGGEEPTITDAHVVLGRLDPDRFLGGRMTARPRRRRRRRRSGSPTQLGLAARETAEGILTIANSNMARAIRSRTIEKGHDPREFALVAFGGAGPLHAAEVADSLGIPEVLVPPYPGITSAAGLLTSDLKYDQMRTVFQTAGLDRRRPAEPRARRPRGASCAAGSRATASPTTTIEVIRALDCRYVGQGYELRVTLDEAPFTEAALERVPPAARARVRQRLRRPDRDRQRARDGDRQAADARRAAGRARHPRRRARSARARATSASTGSCRRCTTRFYDRVASSRSTSRSRAPAVVFHLDTTTVVPPGWTRARRPLRQPDPRRRVSARDAPYARASTRSPPPSSHGALDSIAVEMGHKLARMAYSSIIRESEDFGCVLCDAEAPPAVRVVAVDAAPVGPDPRLHRAASTAASPSSALEWKPGDVVIHNHAYYGASHQPDVGFVVPVFHGGELVGFSATTAHHLDLGALTPGSCGIVDATDAYAEGLQFNAIKIEEEGRRNDWIWQILRDNCRAPQLVVGDMEAQVAACKIGAGALRGADRALRPRDRQGRERGPHGLLRSDAPTRDREAPRRHATRPRASSTASPSIPTRRYRDLRIKVAVTVEGSDINVDLTGTVAAGRPADQHAVRRHGRHRDLADAPLDPARRVATSRCRRTPASSGRSRSSRPRAASPTRRFPAPTIARFCGGQHHRRHGHARPRARPARERQRGRRQPQGRRLLRAQRTAASTGSTWTSRKGATAAATARTGSTRSTRSTRTPATTRSRTSSRTSRCASPSTSCSRTGGGPGRWRGGLGSVREIEFLDDAGCSLEGDGSVWAPPGLFGGGDGTPGAVVLNRGTARTSIELPSKFPYRTAQAGDRLCLISPCGGGYGDPRERDPTRSARTSPTGSSRPSGQKSCTGTRTDGAHRRRRRRHEHRRRPHRRARRARRGQDPDDTRT